MTCLCLATEEYQMIIIRDSGKLNDETLAIFLLMAELLFKPLDDT